MGGGKGGTLSGVEEELTLEEAGMAEAKAESRRDWLHGYSCDGGSQIGWQMVPSKRICRSPHLTEVPEVK